MATPFFDLVEELRALGGAPKVTYPTGNNNYPQTERTIKAKRGFQTLALGSPEPDTVRFPNNILTEQLELRSDAQVVEVYRKYEVLPGPFTKQGQDYDPQYGFLAEYTEGEVKNGAAIGTALSDIEPENYIKSNLKTYTIPTAALNSFYLTFPATETLDLPKVLTAIEVVWNVTTGTGSYSETGTGAATGSGSVTLSSQGRGQGSASVMADIAPIFAPSAPPNLPVIDYFFFLPNPVTLAAILTRATAVATAIAGTATTVSAWPLFRPVAHTIILSGQKVSASCEATARMSFSSSASGGASYGVTSGSGKNTDFGSTIRAVTLPECIHGTIAFTGAVTNSEASSASAEAYISIGSFTAGSNSPTTSSTPASGGITPTGLGPTPVPAYPASGLYLYKPDVSPYKWGYSAVRARIFDFSILGLPQITAVDFTGLTGANFVTGSAGKYFLFPSLSSGVFLVWFQTGTETLPSGVSYTYNIAVSISSGATSAQIATALAAAFSGLTAIWTTAILSADTSAAVFTSVASGSTGDATDGNTGAAFIIAQQGTP